MSSLTETSKANILRESQMAPTQRNPETMSTDGDENPAGTLQSRATIPMPHPSSIVALDCEMVGTGENGGISSLARVAVIDWEGNIILDTYVIQNRPVTDYRTFVSGITKEILDEATMTLEQVREAVSHFLYNRILIGHALKNDLEALGITHPWWLTRDTATYLPFMKKRFNALAWWPRKLKELASEKLEREIQVLGKPHSPFEDAQAALDLYKFIQPDWETEVYSNLIKTSKFQQQHIADQQVSLIRKQQQYYKYQRQQRGYYYSAMLQHPVQ